MAPRASAPFSDRGGAKENASFAYLCGCDGAHSAVREGLGLGFVGGTYEHVYYVADVRLEDDPGDDAFIRLGAQAFALMMPVRSSGMKRLIGIAPDRPAGAAPLTFEDVRPLAEGLMKVKVASVNWFSTYHVHHRVATRFRVDRCFVAGDAAHVHSPTGGQGMNTGVADAVNLSWKLAHALRAAPSEGLLDTYESERIAFARRLVATTDRAFRVIVDDGWRGRLMRTWIAPRLLPLLLRLPAARREIFARLSQIGVAYRASALGEGRAGAVRGGDRLPWVASGAGGNFDALRSLDWQVHVYGESEPAFAAAAREMGLAIRAFPWSERGARGGARARRRLPHPPRRLCGACAAPPGCCRRARFSRTRRGSRVRPARCARAAAGGLTRAARQLSRPVKAMRIIFVAPGVPNGTPATITTRSPSTDMVSRLANLQARAVMSSMSLASLVATACTPHTSDSRRAVSRLGGQRQHGRGRPLAREPQRR